MKHLIFFLPFLVLCSRSNLKEVETIKPDRYVQLKEMRDEKIKNLNWINWPSMDDCDGMLWAGLARAAGVTSVDLSLGEYDDQGQIQRRPNNPCWKDGQNLGSVSTVSRDMVLGYLFGRWRSRDSDAIKRFAERSERKNWVIGEPYPQAAGEVLLTGNLIGLLGRLTCELSSDCPEYRKIQPVHSKSEKDYVQHLTVLFMILDAEVWKGVKSVALGGELELLKWHSERSPNDALFSAAYHNFSDGDFNHATDLLLDPNFQPPSYVRGSPNYRDVHWLFVADLILRRYNP